MMDYFNKMGKDGRIISVYQDNQFHTFLAISICNDYLPYAKKDIWEYLPHDPQGRICFVEKMVSRKWTKQLRREIEKAIIQRFPAVEEAVWFRPSDTNEERKVKYRRPYEASL